jgi:hypothetical protein
MSRKTETASIASYIVPTHIEPSISSDWFCFPVGDLAGVLSSREELFD